MTPRALVHMVLQNVRRGRRQFLLSTIGIASGIAWLTFFLALSSGVRGVVLGRIFHADRLEIEPPKSTIDVPLVGGPRLIDDAQVDMLRQLDGVKSVAPRMRIAFPGRMWGGAALLGHDRYAELLGDGIDPSAVDPADVGPEPFADLEAGHHDYCESDAWCKKPGEYCTWDVHLCEKPVPFVVSRFLVEMYNSTVATAHHLPRIGSFLASRFRGLTITVELGQSFLGGGSRGLPRQRHLMLVGVSDRAIPIGISFPLPYVKRWNAEYAGPASASGYSSVTVEVADRSAVTRVAAAARAAGLVVADSGAEQAGLAITLLTLLVSLVSLAIVAVAVMNIVHTFYRAVTERRREIGVLRAVGASAGDVMRLLLGEAAAIGFVGGIAGVVAAVAGAWTVDVAAARWVPDFPFKPETFFHFGPALVAAVLGFAVLACVCGALLPARAAAKLEPAVALTAV